MNAGLTIFALGVIGLAAAAAMVAPTSETPVSNEAAPNIVARELKPPAPAPQPGVMITNISSGPAVAVKMLPPPPNPPIVAIPRIPGPADMMVAREDRELATLQSFPSNEACDEALRKARGRHPDAFCVSTTMPVEPKHGFLIEVDVATNELMRLETFPSMPECEAALAGRVPRAGLQRACIDKIH